MLSTCARAFTRHFNRTPVTAIYVGIILFINVVPVRADDPVNAALTERNNPSSLRFLTKLQLPPDLNKLVASDVQKHAPSKAEPQVINRLRFDLIANGVIDPHLAGLAAHVLSSPETEDKQISSNKLNSWRQSLYDMSRRVDVPNYPELRSALPDAMVLTTAMALYNHTIQQTYPGTPAEQPATDDRANSPGPIVNVGLAGTQVVPGTNADILDKCDKDFDTLSQQCGGLKNGLRCETFSRRQFGEVAKITTPSGELCSGTLINDHWILSAAHCFIPSQSAATYGAAFAGRRNAAGDAVIKGGDLLQTAVFLPFANLKDPRRHISEVVVNSQWDPKGTAGEGPTVIINGQSVPAKFGYPGDLALIHISDADAVTSVTPAAIPKDDYTGVVTTAGYGVTTAGNGQSGSLWVTWPTPAVRASNGQLELDLINGPQVSTFCSGDSGGPAFEGRQRGCPSKPEALRPRPLVGVSSYYYGIIPGDGANAKDEAGYCMAAPIMRFVNLSASINHKWICQTSSGVSGCN